MKYKSLLFVSCLAVISYLPSAFAAELPEMSGVPTASAETVGMSSERLQRIDSVMQAYIDRNEIAGAVTLVARRGKVAYFNASGVQNPDTGKPG